MSDQWEGCEEVHLDCRIAQLETELARLTAELAELRERISKAREAFYANFDAANAAITMIDILNDAEIPEPPEATDVDN